MVLAVVQSDISLKMLRIQADKVDREERQPSSVAGAVDVKAGGQLERGTLGGLL